MPRHGVPRAAIYLTFRAAMKVPSRTAANVIGKESDG